MKLQSGIWVHLRKEHFPLIKWSSSEVQNYNTRIYLVCMEKISMPKMSVRSDSIFELKQKKHFREIHLHEKELLYESFMLFKMGFVNNMTHLFYILSLCLYNRQSKTLDITQLLLSSSLQSEFRISPPNLSSSISPSQYITHFSYKEVIFKISCSYVP